tara:strand:+ start:218 stop:949 length:732 start_codon:yes stop_codon:yes gene_type:complete
MADTYVKSDRNKYGLPKGLKSSGGGKKSGGMSTDTFKKMRDTLTMSFDYENLDEATRRNIKNPKYRNADGSFNKEKYDADKGTVETKKGGGRPRKKGGAIVKTQSSSITPASKSEIVKAEPKSSKITKPEPEAKDQTVDVKADKVKDKGEIVKSKNGAIEKSNTNKAEPGKPKDDKIKLTKNKQSLGVGKVLKKAGPYVKAAAKVAQVAYKGIRAVGGATKAFDPKDKGWESYIQRTTDHMID